MRQKGYPKQVEHFSIWYLILADRYSVFQGTSPSQIHNRIIPNKPTGPEQMRIHRRGVYWRRDKYRGY